MDSVPRQDQVVIEIFADLEAKGLTPRDSRFLWDLACDLLSQTQRAVGELTRLSLSTDYVVSGEPSTFAWQPNRNFVLEAHIVLPDDAAAWRVRDQVEHEVMGYARSQLITYKTNRDNESGHNPLQMVVVVVIRGHEQLVDAYADQEPTLVVHNDTNRHDPRSH